MPFVLGQEPFKTFNVSRVTEGQLSKYYYSFKCYIIAFFTLKPIIDLALRIHPVLSMIELLLLLYAIANQNSISN